MGVPPPHRVFSFSDKRLREKLGLVLQAADSHNRPVYVGILFPLQ